MSIAGDILTAAEAVVTGLALSPTPTIRRRKRPAFLEGETGPLICLSVGDGEQTEQLCTRAGARRFLTRFPLSVAIGFRSLGKTGDNPTLREWRQAISTALLDWYGGLRASGLSDVNDVTAGGKPVFDPGAFSTQGIDWGEETFTVEHPE